MKIVMKFGGTSIADGKKICHVAELLKTYCEEGNQIVVVTSALGGGTHRLLENALLVLTKGKFRWSRVKNRAHKQTP